MGVHDVRLTGGEPLVSRDFPTLATCSRTFRVHELSVTTNGFLLERDAEALVRAGVDRFNVSVDSLQRDRFYQLTRRERSPRCCAGWSGWPSFPEAHPIKINAVAIRGLHRGEVLPFAELARRTPTRCVSSSSCRSTPTTPGAATSVLTGDEIRAAIEAGLPLEPSRSRPHSTARVYRFADGRGKIGFINPVSEPFCADCDRIRLTADGTLRTCLFLK